MSDYRIIDIGSGEYALGKVRGDKVTILPKTSPRFLRRTSCDSIEEVLDLQDFKIIRYADPNSMGKFHL